eukprot:6194636-Pleurochrysis_carterae.AAC.6
MSNIARRKSSAPRYLNNTEYKPSDMHIRYEYGVTSQLRTGRCDHICQNHAHGKRRSKTQESNIILI